MILAPSMRFVKDFQQSVRGRGFSGKQPVLIQPNANGDAVFLFLKEVYV